MLEKIDPEAREWLELLDSLTEDQLATAHLLLAYYVELQFASVYRKKPSTLLSIYLKRVSTFIKETRWNLTDMLTYHGTLATYAFAQILKEVWNLAPSKQAVYNGIKILQIIKQILEDYQNVIGQKTFFEYFDDITYLEGKIFSRKVSNLIMLALFEGEIQDDHKNTEDEEDREDESSVKNKRLIEHYTESWNSLRPFYDSLSMERFLLFHGVSLLLCRNCFEERQYTKYRKHVTRALKSFVLSLGKYDNKNSIHCLKIEMFSKLKEMTLEVIDKSYEQDSPFTRRFELFTIATDIFLKDVSKMRSEDALKILFALDKDKNGIFNSGKLEGYALSYNKAAQDELEKLTSASEGPVTTKAILLNKAEPPAPFDNGSQDTIQTEESSKKNSLEADALEKEDSTEEVDSPDVEDSIKEGSLKEIECIIQVDEAILADSYKKLSKILTKLKFEHALFFHTISINILTERDYLLERYEAYKLAVQEAFSAYKNNCDSSVLKQNRKSSDKEFRKLFRSLIKQFTRDELKSLPYEFMSLFETANAIDLCLEDTPNINQDTVEKILSGVEYIPRLTSYISEAAEAYTLKYLIRARRDIKETCLES